MSDPVRGTRPLGEPATPVRGTRPLDETSPLRPSAGATAPAPSAPGSPPSTTQTARDQASSVASDAGDAGRHVAGVAKEQAADVVGEARRQASDLLHQGRSQLREQSTAGQQRAASGLSSLASELKDLAEGKGGSGIATDLAHQASRRVDAVGSWLGEREPADVLREVEGFARRRPVAFLAIAAGVGLVAGRLTRGLSAAAHDGPDAASGGGTSGAQAAPVVPPVVPPVADPLTEPVVEPVVEPGAGWTAPGTAAAPAVDERAWDGPLR